MTRKRTMPGLDWLTARPIAHRGRHNKACGVVENSESAVTAAIDGDFAIEVDIQLTADDEAIVFHDFGLKRLTGVSGAVRLKPYRELTRLTYAGSADRIMGLRDLLDLVDGRVPLIIEMKSAEDGVTALARGLARAARDYPGPIAAMSFDPALVNTFRKALSFVPRGLVSYRYDDDNARLVSPIARFCRRHLLDAARCAPHFIAYDSRALPAVAPRFAQRALGMPLLSWTVRSAAEAARLAPHVDQIIFEDFRPALPTSYQRNTINAGRS